MKDLLSIRTLLFAPGNKPEQFELGREVGADGVIIDLEDAVAFAAKDEGRQAMVNYFKTSTPFANFLRTVRINSIKSLAGMKDIVAILDNKIMPDILFIPKADSAAEIKILDELLKSQPVPYMAFIESALGVQYCDAIATSSPNLKGLCLGGADLSANLGASLNWESMLFTRSRIVQAAAIAGISVLDMPYFKLDDDDNSKILTESKRAKELGFTGKLALHPKHVESIVATFTPSEAELQGALRIVAAYKEAQGNTCEVAGKIIDAPMYRAAKRILAIAAREE